MIEKDKESCSENGIILPNEKKLKKEVIYQINKKGIITSYKDKGNQVYSGIAGGRTYIELITEKDIMISYKDKETKKVESIFLSKEQLKAIKKLEV